MRDKGEQNLISRESERAGVQSDWLPANARTDTIELPPPSLFVQPQSSVSAWSLDSFCETDKTAPAACSNLRFAVRPSQERSDSGEGKTPCGRPRAEESQVVKQYHRSLDSEPGLNKSEFRLRRSDQVLTRGGLPSVDQVPFFSVSQWMGLAIGITSDKTVAQLLRLRVVLEPDSYNSDLGHSTAGFKVMTALLALVATKRAVASPPKLN